MVQPAFRRELTRRIEQVGGSAAAVWRPVDPLHHKISRAVDQVEGVHTLAYELTVPRVLGVLRASPGTVERVGAAHRKASRAVFEGLRTVHWYV